MGMTPYAWGRRLASAATHRLWRGMVWAGSVGTRDSRARRFFAFGEGTLIAFPPGDVFGEEHIALGAGVLIAAEVTLSVGMGLPAVVPSALSSR